VGYNLYIGEAEVIVHMDERYARMGVKYESSADAPQTTVGDTGNHIYPGHTTWREFCKTVGLYSVFYAPECPTKHHHLHGCPTCEGKPLWWKPDGTEHEGLMKDRPGAAPLTEIHLVAFEEARERWLERPEEERQEIGGASDTGRDLVLARLDWLVWWTEWALENCDNPTFANS